MAFLKILNHELRNYVQNLRVSTEDLISKWNNNNNIININQPTNLTKANNIFKLTKRLSDLFNKFDLLTTHNKIECNLVDKLSITTVKKAIDYAKLLNYGKNFVIHHHSLSQDANIYNLILLKEIDEFWFIQVIINIICNSVKYATPHAQNNQLIVNVTEKIIKQNNQNIYRIILRDNGAGILEDKLEDIFLLNYQINDELVGDGLGLAICKEIITQHQGKIYAKNYYDSNANNQNNEISKPIGLEIYIDISL